jgi:hypothetical protein
MKRCVIAFAAVLATLCSLSCGDLAVGTRARGGKIVDHLSAKVDGITDARTAAARSKLRIVYWHTSHGSQLTTGLTGMDAFYGDTGRFVYNGLNGPFFDDRYSEESVDLGNPGRTAFIQRTRDYLSSNPGINVVMWSWCGQADTSAANIDIYLNGMSALEADYPEVAFVYMTGHANGTGLSGNLHQRDQQIRDYCAANGKWLYDFYDIECYDPDGTYFGNKRVSDACNYDYDNDGTTEGDESGPSGDDRNWAQDWQVAHPGEWWSCSSAHSQPLNANQKAKAAWQLWCAIADGM